MPPDAKFGMRSRRPTSLEKAQSPHAHTNREVGALLGAAGFHTEDLRTGYMRGPKIATFMYEGQTCPR